LARSLYAKLDRRFGRRPTGAERRATMLARQAELNRAMPAGWLEPASRRREERPLGKVAVVGGGFAGLASAYWLARARFEVRVFEARKRVGGRVHTLRDFSPGRLIEGGAELIGLNHSLWIALAQRFGLAFCAVTPEDDVDHLGLEMPLYLEGERLSRKRAEEVWDELEKAVSRLDVHAWPLNPYRPWDSPHAASLDSRPLSDWLNELDVSRMCRAALEAQFASNNAEPTAKQSYLANLSIVKGGGLKRFWTDSEMFRCATGNDSLARALCAWLDERESSSVALRSPVTEIALSDTGVSVRTAAGADTFDFVVLAIPPSVWRSNGLKIDPPIPSEYELHMGPAVKFLSSMSQRFWLDQGLAPSGMDDRIGETWEGTDNQTLQDGQGIELTVFAGGDAARTALAEPDPESWYAERLDVLFPGYSAQGAKTRLMAWPKKRWTRGGYSCPPPGQVTSVGPLLAERYCERLVFAGEHTCPAFYGFMEGALESGCIAAARVCEAVGVASVESVESALLSASSAGHDEHGRSS
jgi:monoamine oxidase